MALISLSSWELQQLHPKLRSLQIIPSRLSWKTVYLPIKKSNLFSQRVGILSRLNKASPAPVHNYLAHFSVRYVRMDTSISLGLMLYQAPRPYLSVYLIL